MPSPIVCTSKTTFWSLAVLCERWAIVACFLVWTMGPMTTACWFCHYNCTSRYSSMMFSHAGGCGMGLCYGSLAAKLLLGGKWAIALLFYPLGHLTLKRNGAALWQQCLRLLPRQLRCKAQCGRTAWRHP
jgi:hypothetical protein